eukprot:15162292-Alexandrium_andersonii.AAC.1
MATGPEQYHTLLIEDDSRAPVPPQRPLRAERRGRSSGPTVAPPAGLGWGVDLYAASPPRN